MDEILFHITQSLEALQVHLHSGAQHGRHLLHNYSEQVRTYAMDVWSGPRCVQIQENIQYAWHWLLEFSQEMRRLSLDILNLQQMCNRLMRFMGDEMYRTSMYFGCAGFVLGGIVGITVGLSWQKKQLNVPRMKAIVCNSYRGSDALMMIEDVPAPVITMLDEVLVQVKAASVDLVDIKICSGYGRVLRKQLSRYSNFVDYGLLAGTLLQKQILVHMGCSPVGCILIQLARLWGAHITATASLRAIPVAQALGAHDVVCGEADVQKQLEMRERFDVIFNTEGSVAHEPCLKFCKPGGFVITTERSKIASDTYGFFFDAIYAFWIRIRCLIQGPTLWGSESMGPAVLDQLAKLLEDGSLQPVVDKIFTPQDAELAFQHADSSEAIGKTIIRFRSQQLLRGTGTKVNGTASI